MTDPEPEAVLAVMRNDPFTPCDPLEDPNYNPLDEPVPHYRCRDRAAS